MTKPTPKPVVVRLAYSVGETAQSLDLAPVTIHRAISHGLIVSKKYGRVIRIPAAEVERLAAEGLPPIPRGYLRKTSGPTRQGRPRKVAKPAPKPVAPRRKRGEVERRAQS